MIWNDMKWYMKWNLLVRCGRTRLKKGAWVVLSYLFFRDVIDFAIRVRVENAADIDFYWDLLNQGWLQLLRIRERLISRIDVSLKSERKLSSLEIVLRYGWLSICGCGPRKLCEGRLFANEWDHLEPGLYKQESARASQLRRVPSHRNGKYKGQKNAPTYRFRKRATDRIHHRGSIYRSIAAFGR